MSSPDDWRDIIGYEGYYQINQFGSVRGLDRILPGGRKWKGQQIKVRMNGLYKAVSLKRKGKHAVKHIHRILAQAFIPNPDNLPEIDHIDCNKLNNSLSNLEWVTTAENGRRATLNKLRKIGEEHSLAKLTTEKVKEIKNLLAKENLSHRKIAEIFNVSRPTISSIAKGATWSHVN